MMRLDSNLSLDVLKMQIHVSNEGLSKNDHGELSERNHLARTLNSLPVNFTICFLIVHIVRCTHLSAPLCKYLSSLSDGNNCV